MDKLIEIDGKILLWIQEHLRAEWLNPIVKGITYLGEMGGMWALLCLALLIIPKTRRLGIVCSCSLALTFLIDNVLLKNLIARTRPYEVVEHLQRIVGKQSDFSFPSGHSGASFAVATVLLKETPKRYGVPAIILAALISLSRLYVGVHYPTDVAVGILMGTLFGLLCCSIYHKTRP